ncbi:MAG: hypothetical protein M3340_05390 [Actinomycetota bacterium]|nr:hypothetical protein [Actinomycetota bacterium]
MTVITRPNSWVAVEEDPATQLTYAPQVDPAPLTVSVEGRDPTLGSLTVVITNGGASELEITSVTFTIVVGTPGEEGTPLMPTTKGSKTLVSDTTTWSFNGPAGPVKSGTADYVLAPASGSAAPLAAGASVYVQIYDFQTVPTPSTSTVTVAEVIGGGDPAFTNLSVSTFPDGFFFDSLTANVEKGSALVPVAQVPNGSVVTLTWNSSVVDTKNQTVYYSSATGGQQSGAPTSLGAWTSPPLTSDTMFAVVVTAQSTGAEPLTAALATSVSVQNPALVATSVQTGTLAATGNASVSGGLSANAVTATGVTVNGALSANSANVSGALSAGGNLSVTGSSTLGGTTVGGGLTVNGGSTLASATVQGALSGTGSASLANLTVSGGLNAGSAPVSMLGTGKLLWSGTSIGTTGVQALTDGFAVVQINGPGDNSKSSFAYGAVYTIGTWFQVLGGTVGSFGSGWSDVMNNNNNSMCIPIPRNAYWYYAGANPSGSQMNSPIYVYWFPLGSGGGGETIRAVSEAEAAELAAPPPPPQIDLADGRADREAAAADFVSALEQAFGKELGDAQRASLAERLARL